MPAALVADETELPIHIPKLAVMSKAPETQSTTQPVAMNQSAETSNVGEDEDSTPPSSDSPQRSSSPKPEDQRSQGASDPSLKQNTIDQSMSSTREGSQISKKKRDGGMFAFLTLKEPSTRAWEEFAGAEKKKSKGRGRLSGVSTQKLPAYVPKVNSKWDGLPEGAKKTLEAKKANQYKRESTYSTSTKQTNWTSVSQAWWDENDRPPTAEYRPSTHTERTMGHMSDSNGVETQRSPQRHFLSHSQSSTLASTIPSSMMQSDNLLTAVPEYRPLPSSRGVDHDAPALVGIHLPTFATLDRPSTVDSNATIRSDGTSRARSPAINFSRPIPRQSGSLTRIDTLSTFEKSHSPLSEEDESSLFSPASKSGVSRKDRNTAAETEQSSQTIPTIPRKSSKRPKSTASLPDFADFAEDDDDTDPTSQSFERTDTPVDRDEQNQVDDAKRSEVVPWEFVEGVGDDVGVLRKGNGAPADTTSKRRIWLSGAKG